MTETVQEPQDIIKAGARHNKYDKETLSKMMNALFDLGAVCPFCENMGKHSHGDEPDSKAPADTDRS